MSQRDDRPVTIRLSEPEEKLILRLRQLGRGGFQFVTLDLDQMAIVRKWSDSIERFAKSQGADSKPS